MVLRFTVLILVILTFPLKSVQSQNDERIYWGPNIDSQRGANIIALFGTDSKSFYTLQRSRKKRDGYSIQKIDTDSLVLVKDNNFNFLERNGSIPELHSVISVIGHNYLIATNEDTGLNLLNILAYEVLEDGKVSEIPVLMASASVSALNNQDDFKIVLSKDNQSICLIIPTEETLTLNEKFELSLFDANLQVIHSKSLELPYSSSRVGIEDAIIGDSAHIYILASLRDTELESLNKDRNIGRDYSLVQYNWDEERMTEKSLALGQKWLYDVRLLFNSKSNLQIVGYYSNMVDLVIAGTFSVEFDQKTGKAIEMGITPFDRDFRAGLLPENSRASEIDLLKLDYIFPFDSSLTVMLSEKTYVEISQNFNPATGSYTTLYIYNYDEILLSVINPGSEIVKTFQIPKFQSSNSKSSSYTSYMAHTFNGKLYLLYNDHERNNELSVDKKRGYRQLTSASNGQLIMLEIDKKGKVRKIPLFTTSSARASFVPDFIYETPNGIIIMAKSGYHTQYFKIRLQ